MFPSAFFILNIIGHLQKHAGAIFDTLYTGGSAISALTQVRMEKFNDMKEEMCFLFCRRLHH